MCKNVHMFFVVVFLSVLAGFGCSKKKMFSDFERYYIMNGGEDEVLPLVENDSPEGDRMLRRKSREVSPDNYIAKHLAKRMKATVLDAPGVGIAAPQVGFDLRMIWVKRIDRAQKPLELYYNPEITEFGPETKIGWEGCLSVPAGFGKVSRSTWIRLSYETPDGRTESEKVSGYTAIIFQHEIDHLDGTLFIDRKEKGALVPKEEYRAMRKREKAAEEERSEKNADSNTASDADTTRRVIID